ncbi:MAG TPA: UDP-N-acetylmuramoyl-tripeptide--D-alanyl-D-alanine ligase [Candidatus Limnocylindrales bacterium]
MNDPRQPATAERPAFDAAALATATGGRVVRTVERPIRGGAVDSRRVEPGNAFFALPGERTDGHRFLAEAANRGAAALVVSELPPETQLDALAAVGASVIAVGDGLAALQSAAAAWRSRFDPLIVGVTGSLAKTSVKEQAAEVLAERWGEQVLRNPANENNEIGLPLTLLRLDAGHQLAVLEMGMYVPGDIALLAALARPRIGVVTAVRETHLSRAGSIEAIEAGKRELVEALPANGTAILNADDERVSRMAAVLAPTVRVLRYGFAAAADVTAVGIETLAERGMRFTLRTPLGEQEVESPALGRHGVHNALAGAAVGIAAGLDMATIVAGLARPYRAPHRSTLVEMGPWLVLDDSYNAAPDSMAAALDLLATLPGRKVAVLGEMLELGEGSAAAHRAVGEHAGRVAGLVVAVGPTADLYAAGAAAGPAEVHALADHAAAAELLAASLRPGDVVLLKGSRGAAMDELLPVLERLAGAGARA